jgi:hypothetical protein
MLLINVYHGGQILNTSTSVGYDIRDLKRQIHICLKMLRSHFNINISAQINTASPSSTGFFIIYLGLFLKKFGEWLKQQLCTKYPGIKYWS